jgi:UPF0755 protein
MTLSPSPLSRLRAARPLAIVALVVLAGVGIVAAASALAEAVGSRFGDSASGVNVDVDPGLPVVIEIPLGSSTGEIALILEANGVIRSATQFEALARTSGVASNLQAGTYDLFTLMNPDEVLSVLVRGPVTRVIRITIPEGLRVAEIIERLAIETGREEEEFEAALTDGSVTTSLREMPPVPVPSDWEGLLFPDTYEFAQSASPADLLNRLARTMEDRVASVDWTEFEAAGFTRYQGIVIASLIESEVRVADERPLVSSVVRNRLRDSERLEIDATVLYAVNSRDPRSINLDVDSPYNTYRVAGLPPTPISAPGLASLQAAAAPATTDFKFYVLSAPDGSHTFSVTFEEHLVAVEKARADGLLGG